LTHDGRIYLEGCRRVLNEIDHLDISLESSRGLKGTLRVAAPLTFGETTVAAATIEFMETHPDPAKALSDGPNAWPLGRMEQLLSTLKQLDDAVKQQPFEESLL
jgi:3-deoxy-D-manno-octulosonic acid (KDO) 8-phosphate synthase